MKRLTAVALSSLFLILLAIVAGLVASRSAAAQSAYWRPVVG